MSRRTWGRRPRVHIPPAAVLAATVFWGLLVLACPASGQVTASTTLGPEGTGRILVDNRGTDLQFVTVEVWESREDGPEGVKLTREVPATVWPDSFRLAPGGHQTVRLRVPVDSLGYAPGRLLRVLTVFAPPPPPEAERDQQEGVRTVIRRVLRYVTKLRVGS